MNTEVPITSVVLLHQNDRFWTLLSDTISQLIEQFLQLVSNRRTKPFSRVRTDTLLAPHNRGVLRPKARAHSGSLSLNNVEMVAFSSHDKGKQKDGVPEPADTTENDLRDFVLSSVIPLLTSFCSRHFTVSDSTKEYVATHKIIAGKFNSFFKATCGNHCAFVGTAESGGEFRDRPCACRGRVVYARHASHRIHSTTFPA